MCPVSSKHSINDLFPDIYLLAEVKLIHTNSHAQFLNDFYLEGEHKYKSTYFKLRTKASELP